MFVGGDHGMLPALCWLLSVMGGVACRSRFVVDSDVCVLLLGVYAFGFQAPRL